MYVLSAQKNRLTEMVLLITHSICFGCEIKIILFNHILLSGGMSLLFSQGCGNILPEVRNFYLHLQYLS